VIVARAIELKHHKDQCFLLLVKTSTDGVLQPKEGDACLVSLPNIPTSRDGIVEHIFRTAINAQGAK
jgi:hypothetical protein